jgi:hypothetical protein
MPAMPGVVIVLILLAFIVRVSISVIDRGVAVAGSGDIPERWPRQGAASVSRLAVAGECVRPVDQERLNHAG